MENFFRDYTIKMGILKRNDNSHNLKNFFNLNLNSIVKDKYVCFLFLYDNNSSLVPILLQNLTFFDIQKHILEYLAHKLYQEHIKSNNIFLIFENDLKIFANQELQNIEKEINTLKKINCIKTNIKYIIVPNLDFFH